MAKQQTAISLQSIRGLTAADLGSIYSWCRNQWEKEQFLPFVQWLANWAEAELSSRQRPSYEPGSLEFPPTWDGQTIADSMLASFILVRLPLNESLAKFADELHLKAIVNGAAVLSEITFEVSE